MNPADLGHRQQFVHGEPAFGPPLAQSLHRDGDADLVSVFETVGDRLGGGSDSDPDSIDLVIDHARRQCLSAEPDDVERWITVHRMTRLAVDGDPNFMRRLRGDFVEDQSGHEADDPVWHAYGGLSQAVIFGDGVAGNRVYSPTEAGNQAIRQRTLERSPWNAEMREIARADYRRLSQHWSELGIAGSSHVWTIQYVGTCLQVPST